MNASSPGGDTAGLPFPLQAGEEVLMLCRRHWIYFWPNLLVHFLALLVAPVSVDLLLDAIGAFEGIAASAFWAVAGVWILYWAVSTFLA